MLVTAAVISKSLTDQFVSYDFCILAVHILTVGTFYIYTVYIHIYLKNLSNGEMCILHCYLSQLLKVSLIKEKNKSLNHIGLA